MSAELPMFDADGWMDRRRAATATTDEIATALRVMTAIRGLHPDEVATLIRAAELLTRR